MAATTIIWRSAVFKEKPACKNSLTSRKLIFGVGVNDSTYTTKYKLSGRWVRCPFYAVWFHMLQRCYDDKFKLKNPTYNGCSVDKEWHVFSVFKLWMLNQDWQGKQLDKDLIRQGNSVYSDSTCCFLTSNINSAIKFSKSDRGDFMAGVRLEKRTGKYYASYNRSGKQLHIGTYNTERDASNAYKKEKYKIIAEYAEDSVEPIKSALLRIVIPDY